MVCSTHILVLLLISQCPSINSLFFCFAPGWHEVGLYLRALAKSTYDILDYPIPTLETMKCFNNVQRGTSKVRPDRPPVDSEGYEVLTFKAVAEVTTRIHLKYDKL